MADNVTSNPGAGGYIFATDEVGGAHHPYTKMEFGADNEATPVSSANPLPVVDTPSGNFLWRILQMLMSPMGFDSSLNRMRETAIIESGTVTTVSTLTTVTNAVPIGNVATVDGRNGAMMINAMDSTAWALNVRSRIT